MIQRASTIICALGLSLGAVSGLAACGKGEEAAKAAAEQAQATATQAAAAANEAADKAKAAAAAAEAEAKAAAQKLVDEKKASLKTELEAGIAAFDRKVTYLKEKAEKLPKAAKKKADEAIAAYDGAKASALALLPTIDTLPDVPSLAEVSGKISAALAEAGAKLNDAEAAALPKKK
jgi:molecular chaperone GrpE (heat shock protein)